MHPEKELYLSSMSPVKLLFIGGLSGRGSPSLPSERLCKQLDSVSGGKPTDVDSAHLSSRFGLFSRSLSHPGLDVSLP